MEPTGSGDGVSLPTMEPLRPITTEPPMPPRDTNRTSQLSEWLESTWSWGGDFTRWETFARSQSGLQLDDSISSHIIDRLNNGVDASTVRSNSAEWVSLLSDWREGYDTYTGTFSGLCPKL